ncbi:hypothetical protein [Acinetobacter populi]|uniref:Uncharacterized protein n=1 Tax=Acinetobacter populi TaxID=1582270 RepID=A0A1Z9YX14_9GAMM|nr:hypothetical protein [Acinetobacter populi]OUY06740.1 hypothetical protein CAP51_12505 [Acinetobacter populi]
MSLKRLYKLFILGTAALITVPSYAGLSFGDAETGQLNVSGTIRAKYIYNFDTEPTTSKLSFNDAVLWLDYSSPHWIGRLDYRAYEYYGHIGDASWLTDAWLGYKINDQHKIIAGLNPVPFGLGRFWGNNYYLGIGNAAGLEDVHNLGIKYDYQNDKNEIQIAYYPRDGGNFQGHSKDARRFSINPVEADDYVTDGTYTREKNSFVIRAAHTFDHVFDQENFSSQIGASAWYSTIENKRTHQNGDRQVYSVFSNTNYNQWNLQLLAGFQDIDNADDTYPDHLTLGGFDSSFNSATEGQIYSAEVSYLFPHTFGALNTIRPYLNYSAYQKKQNTFKDSERIIAGLSFNYQKWTINSELLIGKHDPFLGDSDGLAAGGNNTDWNKRLFVSLAYYF